jgi:tetratricopeptide (TPR) repeat protein
VERLAEVFNVPQGQRKIFLRFAQGDWQAGKNGEFEDVILRDSELAPQANIPRSMLNLMVMQEVEGLLGFTWESPHMSEKLALIQKALALAESDGDTRRQIETLWQLGWLDQVNRFFYWEKALGLARRLGDAQGLASGLSMMGFFLVLNGDLDPAQRYLAESSALYQQLRLKPVTSHLFSAYGQISLIRGDFKKARSYLQKHARDSLDLGNREDYLWSNVRLGYVALAEGNLDEAHRTFVESAREFKKDKNIIGVVFTLEGLAGLHAKARNPTQAAHLIGWADSTREKISDQRPLIEQADVDRMISSCSAQLGKGVFTEIYDKGQKMTMDEAVHYALN